MKKWLQLWMGAVWICTACNPQQKTKEMLTDKLKKEAVDTLQQILHKQQGWVKVHAAEFLIGSGNDRDVKNVFFKELEQYAGKPQYRIGIWRVLVRISDSAESAQYKKQIVNAFIDTAGSDRIHAIETMAKLKISPLPQYPEITRAALLSDTKSLSAYTHWAVAYTNGDSAKAARKYFIERLLDAHEDILQQRIAAYVLRNGGNIEVTDWHALSNEALALPDTVETKISFLNAALLTAPQEERNSEVYKNIFSSLLAFSNKRDKGVRMEIAAGLAVAGDEEHLPLLTDWMRNTAPTGNVVDDADVQASAAYAILKVCENTSVNHQPE